MRSSTRRVVLKCYLLVCFLFIRLSGFFYSFTYLFVCSLIYLFVLFLCFLVWFFFFFFGGGGGGGGGVCLFINLFICLFIYWFDCLSE